MIWYDMICGICILRVLFFFPGLAVLIVSQAQKHTNEQGINTFLKSYPCISIVFEEAQVIRKKC